LPNTSEGPSDSQRIAEARRLMDPCRACARQCEARRFQGQVGFCKTGAAMVVASAGPHFGEEPPLVGRGGSGTIFLAGCNLDCLFCQNWDISHSVQGRELAPPAMAELMLSLETRGCENVNFVTPSHVGPLLLESIILARQGSLRIPIVWNCGGYESLEMLRLLDGLVEIYMPDIKYADEAVATKYSDAPGYVSAVRAAVTEMHRQVGDLQITDGVATRGLLVRHLVLPDDLAGSTRTIDFLADEISPHTYLNVMAQYHPAYNAHHHPPLDRPPTPEEFRRAYQHAGALGLRLAR